MVKIRKLVKVHKNSQKIMKICKIIDLITIQKNL